MITKLRFVLLFFAIGFEYASAQAPTISYASPKVYSVDTTISPLSPTSTGVAAPGYSSTAVTIGSGFSKPTSAVVDASGNIYEADSGSGKIFKIPAGSNTPIAIASVTNPLGIAVDGSGNVYVTAIPSTNVIYEIPVGGGNTISIPFASSPANYQAADVLVDPIGNLYISTISVPNATAPSTVFEIVAGGNAAIILATGFVGISGLTVDNEGNVYAADDGQPNGVYKIPAGGGTPVVIGSGYGESDGVAVDGAGNVYIADEENEDIKEIPFGSSTPVVIGPNFSDLFSLAIDRSGNLYVADHGANAVEEIKPVGGYYINPALPAGLSFNNNNGLISGTPKTTNASTNYTITAYNNYGSSSATINITVIIPYPVITYAGPQIYIEGKTITPLEPTSVNVAPDGNSSPIVICNNVRHPTGVAVDASGDVFIADDDNPIVQEIVAGSSTPVTFSSNFTTPTGVAVDAAGNVYVVDATENTVKKIAAGSGSLTTVANGFYAPYGIAIDAAGNLYVGDASNNEVKKIPAGSHTTVVIGTGFNHPTGVAVDAAGNVYVADRGNNAIKEILKNGETVVLASGDGNPNGVAVDGAGNVYFADTNDSSIIEIPIAGGNEIMVGSGFNKPVAVAVNKQNVVYLSNSVPQQIDAIKPIGGYYISPAMPAGLSFNNSTGIISGTPTVSSAPTVYTILGYNGGLTGSATVNISVLSTNANLANLALSKGTLTPAFATATISYTDIVTNGTASITLTPTVSDAAATVTVNGATVASGAASAVIALSVGNNTITTVVTAQDGTTKQTYTVNVIRPSTNAKLSALTISAGTLSPAFNTNTTSYTASVTASSSTLSPTAAVTGATIKVNGVAVTSGSPSAAIALNVGSNTITIVVTAQDGVTMDTYTLTVTRALSNNANLSNIALSKGTISPAFAATTTSYTDVVTNGTTSITLTPTVADAIATVTVNGTTVASGKASAAIALNIGTNVITTIVTAQDGATQKSYTVNVIRPSTNAKLSALTFSNAGLLPAFNPVTTSYNAPVAYSVTSTTVTPTAAVAGSVITVNGITVASGTVSGVIALSMGANKVTVVVTAQDGVTTNTYTVSVYRSAPSNNAGLAGLTPSKGTLSPAFATSTTNYADTVTNGTASITLTPAVADATATVTVNGTPVVSGHASGAIALSVGSNIISVMVSAQDGTTKKTYTVNVVRPSTNAKLSALTISSGKLTPAFNTNTTSYTASVTNATASITVTPTVAVTGATIKVNGITVTSGTPSAAIALSVGGNTITTIVTAQDGTTTDTYTLTVTRAASGENIPDAGVGVQNFEALPSMKDDGIIVHQGISPNGDGVNDFLVIDGILAYPDNKLSIMNRNGQLVYDAKGYDNATKVFDGHSNKNGQMQLPGTYFYSLDYSVKGIVKHKTGFLVLKY